MGDTKPNQTKPDQTKPQSITTVALHSRTRRYCWTVSILLTFPATMPGKQIDIVDSKASRVEALLRAKKEKKDAIVRARAEEKERVEEERRAKEKTKALKLGAHLAQMKELKRYLYK